jgi:hypothetical protein
MLGKHTLSPKEQTSLKIVFDTKDRPGPFRKKVIITTDTRGEEEIVVTVDGTVREAPGPKIQVNPRKVVVGEVKPGFEKKQEFTIANTGTAPLVIKRIYSKESGIVYFEGAKAGDIVIEPGKTRRLELEIKAHKAEGQSRESIVIESNAKNATKTGYLIMVQYVTGG